MTQVLLILALALLAPADASAQDVAPLHELAKNKDTRFCLEDKECLAVRGDCWKWYPVNKKYEERMREAIRRMEMRIKCSGPGGEPYTGKARCSNMTCIVADKD